MNKQKPLRKRRLWQGGIFAAALLLLGIGIATQDYLTVLQKAVRMCMECMGL